MGSKAKSHEHHSGLSLRPVCIGGRWYVEWSCCPWESEQARDRWRRHQSEAGVAVRDRVGWRYRTPQAAHAAIRAWMQADAKRGTHTSPTGAEEER